MRFLLLLVLFSCASHKEVQQPDVIATLPKEERAPFSTNSALPYMAEVARISNCIISNEDFLKEVSVFPKFTFTDKDSKAVAESLRNFKPVALEAYRTKNPFSSAVATTFASDKKHVYFNTRKNPREMRYMINTSFHEGLHLNNYSHGDNYPNGKEDSVNYRVGSIAEKFVEVCK